jgi:hypothetical protein
VGAKPIGQAAEVANSDEPLGENVQEESALELDGGQGHDLGPAAVGIILPAYGESPIYWKDYRDRNQQKTMTLEADEFIRRFLLHVLPDGFQRIRHYGFLGHRVRQAKLALCRQLLGVALTLTGVVPRQDKPDYRDLYETLTGKSLRECPVCHRGQMVAIAVLSASDRAPPFATP